VIQYAVDTNVFIEAKNRYYPFDMPPGRWFWDLMDRAATAGIVGSAKRMREELLPANDELTAWAKSHDDSVWIPPDTSVLDNVRKLVTWAQDRVGPRPGDLLQAAVDEFARGDVFLVATAAAKDLVVVTHEQSSPAARRRIMIPDACDHAGVHCVDPWTMLKDLDGRLGE
jgi:hypothetical protein